MKTQIVILSAVVATAAALTLVGAAMLSSQPAHANPAIAQKTKLGCPACHTGAPSASSLNARGKKYQSTGK
jgi:hypothetical protein